MPSTSACVQMRAWWCSERMSGGSEACFRVTAGLFDEFGEDRVLDTPLTETGIVGSAIGMALYGLRPVAEIQFADFVYPAFDQIVNELAKYRYRSGNQFECPVLMRMPVGGGIGGGHYHSQSPEAYFAHTAGLKVVIPSNPYDAKGLLLAALESPDPVVFLEPKKLYRTTHAEVPEGHYTVPIGSAASVREGSDVTLLCYGAMVPACGESGGLGSRGGDRRRGDRPPEHSAPGSGRRLGIGRKDGPGRHRP